MLIGETAQALLAALKEWESAKAWADNYAHENVNGEYSEKLKLAHRKAVRAAFEVMRDEAGMVPGYTRLRAAIEQARQSILAAAADLKQSENYVGIDGIFSNITDAQEHLVEALTALDPEAMKPNDAARRTEHGL